MELIDAAVRNIGAAFEKKAFPSIVLWNRLEGKPRTHDFERALKAEVRDALWMLTKQWQMGEFKGDDAGSPTYAKVHTATNVLNQYKAHEQLSQELTPNVPLEVKAEQKLIPFFREKQEQSVDIRLQMGRYWRKLLNKNGLNDYFDDFKEKYLFFLPANDSTSDYIYAHQEVWQQFAAISGRCLDGYKLYAYLKENTINKASDDLILTDVTHKGKLDNLGNSFISWFESLYSQPTEEQNNAWIPERLEYQFDYSASNITVKQTLSAEKYHSGHLDWFGFDYSQNEINVPENPQESSITFKLIPSHVQFEGMPNTRWWKFEDSKTNLSNIKPTTTDLAKLLLTEFGLIYANDWFSIPFDMPIGVLSTVKGIVVTNTFGEHIWIEPASKRADSWKEWNMFDLNTASGDENVLFLAPTLIKAQQSRPIEEVRLIRDEMSNMVWGVESLVPIANGYGKNGNEIGLQIKSFHENILNAVSGGVVQPFATDAQIYYLAMTSVPENWIPFIPVHTNTAESREIQLQRSSMLRIIAGETNTPKIKPQTSLLRHGLDETTQNPYYIFEEEVPRAGVVVKQMFQRTRWTNGEVYTWLSTEKKIGRGEGSSGLAFDQIKDCL